MFIFKRELYANPGRGDLNDLWWGLVELSEVAERYLLEAVFGLGARNGWEDTVLGAIGKPLSAGHFVGGSASRPFGCCSAG